MSGWEPFGLSQDYKVSNYRNEELIHMKKENLYRHAHIDKLKIYINICRPRSLSKLSVRTNFFNDNYDAIRIE